MTWQSLQEVAAPSAGLQIEMLDLSYRLLAPISPESAPGSITGFCGGLGQTAPSPPKSNFVMVPRKQFFQIQGRHFFPGTPRPAPGTPTPIPRTPGPFGPEG